MAQIDHVVVLMLENRSFDSMLGRLYPAGPKFDGLTGNEFNLLNGKQVKVWTGKNDRPGLMTIPDPGPGESFVNMTEQIFGANPKPGAAADMSGFVSNFVRKWPGAAPEIPMHGFTPEQVPVISELARSFGVSDRWHASAPNQTWPNRFFAHTGTAGGYVNNESKHAPFRMPTIFNRLTQKKRSWRIYRHDAAHAMLLSQIWSEVPDHIYHFNPQFLEDARTGNLPNYSFIEPRYFVLPLSSPPNDQHPSHDVGFGERLIARCYQALRNSPVWERTLFIITYDEHGGMYDHVPPPAAVSPDNKRPDGFAFDRYGVRVPAVLISPWIAPGSVIRPPKDSKYPFDHTSILATLRNLFSLGPPLTARDAAAPDLLGALTLPTPSNGGPSHTPLPNVKASPAELAAADAAPPNSMQRALAEAAPKLPTGSARAVEEARRLARAAPASGPTPSTAAEARTFATAGVAKFLRGPAGGEPP